MFAAATGTGWPPALNGAGAGLSALFGKADDTDFADVDEDALEVEFAVAAAVIHVDGDRAAGRNLLVAEDILFPVGRADIRSVELVQIAVCLVDDLDLTV